jgi:S1-C subfamily serine protease
MSQLKVAAILAFAAALAPAQAAAQAAAKPISMGIQLTQVPESPEVTTVLSDRTGAALGFKVGDILIEANGKPVSREVLLEYMKDKKAGDELVFKVKRGGDVVELRGKGVAAPQDAAPPP